MQSSGILASVTGAATAMIGAYTPQAVLDHLPGHSQETAARSLPHADSAVADVDADDSDASSTISSSSFRSADSHLGDESASITSTLSPGKEKGTSSSSVKLTQHEKELQKLNKRRATLDSKLQTARDKLAKDTDQQTEKEKEAIKTAELKHAKEMQKQEEKYKKEVQKLEQKKERDAKKLKEKRKRALDKDEKARVTRERDEAREELSLLQTEKELWLKQVGALQSENTAMAARIGKLEALLSSNSIALPGTQIGKVLDGEKGEVNRSRSSSLQRKGLEGSSMS